MKRKLINIPIIGNIGEIEEEIEGELNAIILNPLGNTEINIMSDLGYKIYESKDITEIKYIPIRVQANDNQGHRISFSSDKYSLNEKLIIKLLCYNYIQEENNSVNLIIIYD